MWKVLISFLCGRQTYFVWLFFRFILTLIFLPSIWSILENILCILEKNMYSAVIGQSVPPHIIKLVKLVDCVIVFYISYFLIIPSIIDNGILKFLIIVEFSNSFSSLFPVFCIYTFRYIFILIVLVFWLPFCLYEMSCFLSSNNPCLEVYFVCY